MTPRHDVAYDMKRSGTITCWRGPYPVKKTLIAAALVVSLSAVAVACDDGDDATPEPTAAAVATEMPEVTEAPAEEATEAPAESVEDAVEEEIADEADVSADEAAALDEANDAEEAVEEAVEEEVADE